MDDPLFFQNKGREQENMELLDFVLKMRHCDVEKRKTHPVAQEDFCIARPTRAVISTHVSFVLSISNLSIQFILGDSDVFPSQIIPKKQPHDHEELNFWKIGQTEKRKTSEGIMIDFRKSPALWCAGDIRVLKLRKSAFIDLSR
jgi:hypothetical protein